MIDVILLNKKSYSSKIITKEDESPLAIVGIFSVSVSIFKTLMFGLLVKNSCNAVKKKRIICNEIVVRKKTSTIQK